MVFEGNLPMKNLFDIDKEMLLSQVDDAVKKKSKMVLSNTASDQTGNVNKSSMASWVKSSPFFLKKESSESKDGD